MNKTAIRFLDIIFNILTRGSAIVAIMRTVTSLYVSFLINLCITSQMIWLPFLSVDNCSTGFEIRA
jgi:hypothetical protein